ncbi:ATP synthase F1 subunit gamma [Candidatus Kaiserbacteria bacterium CG10_big_fil_rev_8_21_14_0_10_59_10]|uniref:ATP synthase gamma chain n=1 Tax=Candidatus Kaiserbacteria bacterium CG10_big_fil_rev_8_21_14_0_10_59_10 TaxID=1974612 RepID=A0A2H0U782_9BACT|nr:MAG: ATP synthase F1 subunit gamma [Candidatus Kaiserbacteria bacterium CG10_big_fil_rev_8_21_14_0_10_59_10]
MAGLKNIKLKIGSTKKTATVTRAMEAVSAVKMRKAQERALSGRAYAAAALSILERLSATADAAKHPLMAQGNGIVARAAGGNTAVVVITSDKGLAGALNSSVIRAIETELYERKIDRLRAPILAIGRRGAEYFASRGWSVSMRQENVADTVTEADMRKITGRLLALYASGEIGAAIVAYTNFLSTFEQKPVVRQILPISPESIRDMVRGIVPAKGRYAGMTQEVQNGPAAYTIEPDADAVLEELLPRLLNIAVFHALLEAKASEHSARMVAMKSATDKAKEMVGDLTRTFNKVRQAAITREVSEITSGIEAMR